MDDRIERRSCRRMVVGPEHTVRFSARGHSFRNVRITNLGSQGCFAMVSQRNAPLFMQGTPLEHFAFEHPDLAGGSVVAKVTYVLGDPEASSALEFMGVGIQFVSMDPFSREVLDRFLARTLNPA